ncbi:hypothetical protein ACJJTC_004572 [Scirpophaga incertulas]
MHLVKYREHCSFLRLDRHVGQLPRQLVAERLQHVPLSLVLSPPPLSAGSSPPVPHSPGRQLPRQLVAEPCSTCRCPSCSVPPLTVRFLPPSPPLTSPPTHQVASCRASWSLSPAARAVSLVLSPPPLSAVPPPQSPTHQVSQLPRQLVAERLQHVPLSLVLSPPPYSAGSPPQSPTHQVASCRASWSLSPAARAAVPRAQSPPYSAVPPPQSPTHQVASCRASWSLSACSTCRCPSCSKGVFPPPPLPPGCWFLPPPPQSPHSPGPQLPRQLVAEPSARAAVPRAQSPPLQCRFLPPPPSPGHHCRASWSLSPAARAAVPRAHPPPPSPPVPHSPGGSSPPVPHSPGQPAAAPAGPERLQHVPLSLVLSPPPLSAGSSPPVPHSPGRQLPRQLVAERLQHVPCQPLPRQLVAERLQHVPLSLGSSPPPPPPQSPTHQVSHCRASWSLSACSTCRCPSCSVPPLTVPVPPPSPPLTRSASCRASWSLSTCSTCRCPSCSVPPLTVLVPPPQSPTHQVSQLPRQLVAERLQHVPLSLVLSPPPYSAGSSPPVPHSPGQPAAAPAGR